MSLFASYVQPLTEWLHANPNWAGLITFLISFTESLAVIGSIVPGSVTMTAIGILIGSGVIPAKFIFLCAIAGAVSGDSASYFIGYYFRDNLMQCWPFSKHPHWLNYGTSYFEKHGGKSVLIGRFIGPLRSIIPIIAGMLRMPNWRFFIANLVSAIGWSFLYILPGVLIGAASTEMSAEAAARFFIYLLLFLLGLWLASLFARLITQVISRFLGTKLNSYWNNLSSHPSTRRLFVLLIDENNPQDHRQFRLFILTLLSAIGWLLFMLFQVTSPITHLDASIMHFMQSIRTPFFDTLFICIHFIASLLTQTLITLSVFLYFFLKKQYRVSFIWLLNGALCLGVATLSQQPNKHMVLLQPLSFWANHILSSTSLLLAGISLLFVLILTQCMSLRMRRYAIRASLSVLALISFCALYLTDSSFSQIISGLLLGMTICLFSYLILRMKVCDNIPAIPLLSLMTLSISLSVYGLSQTRLKHEVAAHQINYPVHLLTFQQWWQQPPLKLPLYRTNRFGKSIALLNLQYLGSLQNLSTTLTEAGWRLPPPTSYLSLAQQIVAKDKMKHLPLFSQLVNNKAPSLVLYKSTSFNNPIAVLRLWRSNHQIINSPRTLWLGSLHYRLVYQKHWHPFQRKNLRHYPIEPLIKPLLDSFTSKTIPLSHQDSLLFPSKQDNTLWLLN